MQQAKRPIIARLWFADKGKALTCMACAVAAEVIAALRKMAAESLSVACRFAGGRMAIESPHSFVHFVQRPLPKLMQPEEFEFVSPPPFPDAPVPDAAALNALQAIEQEMQRSPVRLPEAAVSDFPAPMMTVMYSPHQLAADAARNAVAAALASQAAALPRGVKLDQLASSLRPVFVPRWYLKGEISADWTANGVEVSSREVACPECHGSGKQGMGVNQRDCSSCWGSGKEKQTTRKKHPASGNGRVALVESLANHEGMADLQLEAVHDVEPLLLPDEARMRLRCLRPASVYSSDALDAFKNRLAAMLEEQAKGSLNQYGRVDDFLFAPESVRSHAAVAAWLYPAYLGGCEVPGGQCHVLCDALTGKVGWTQAAAEDITTGAAAAGSRHLVTVMAGIAALAAAFGLWYGLSR